MLFHPQFEETATYEITIFGALRHGWEDWFDDMVISHFTNEQGTTMTKLSGTVDQSALHGILNRIFSLNLKLYSVILIEHIREGGDQNDSVCTICHRNAQTEQDI